MKKLTIALLALFVAAPTVQLQARHSSGRGAGLFFGGLATGAILSSASRRRDYADDEAYIRALQDENADLRSEIRDIRRELRNK